ncbi:MAG TPA: TraR/DksA C4-type zinc finger protein [Tepidisphaeraceae bacterium]|nr:TraR/DksA C4-type zinc finger protein [Tepidisphaeraceae bacterium]
MAKKVLKKSSRAPARTAAAAPRRPAPAKKSPARPAAAEARAKAKPAASSVKKSGKAAAAKVKPARRIVDNSPKPGSGPGPVIMARKRTKTFINPPPPLAPVPTNGKPKKNQAGLSSKELEHFRGLLLDKRRELVGDMSHMEREALRSASGTNLSNLPMHMADMGTDNYEQEFTLGLVEKERVLLREINQALAKIQDGTYGICEGTGKPINKMRLEAQPWARYSIEHARQMERGFIRR